MSGRRPRPGVAPRAWGPLVGACLVAAVAAPPASAEAVSSAELQRLADAASDDPAALDRLGAVDAVDGRPADIGVALEGASSEQLDARLAELARGGAGGAGDADALRASADRILGDLPEPEEPVEEGPDPDESEGEFSVGPFGLIAAALALLGGGLLAYRLASGRERSYAELSAEEKVGAESTPDELLASAERAERDGDYAGAVRLRLRWALGDLGRRGAIEARSSLSPAAAARQLGDPRADELVGTFERVVYGRRDADAADAEAAREGWPRVIDEASVR